MPIPNLHVVQHGPMKSEEQPVLRPKKRKAWKIWLKRAFVFALFLFGIGVIFLIGAFAWYSRSLPDPNKIMERSISQSTKIYDREGETILYDVHGEEKRTLIKLSDLPEVVKQATIATEDRYFYEHHGFNLFAMFKGVIIDPLFGRKARGGSTLTQQLVKNAILTNERSIARKIKEFILSYKIEKTFTKDEILQMYLNEIPYGSVIYGVESASQTFFAKSAKDLTLAEAAILASIPKAPTYYSPYGSHTEDLFGRQRYVLDQMAEVGYITKDQAEAAKKQEIKFALKRQSITAPHFVMYVKDLLTDKLGLDESLVENGGLKVITTLDMKKQTMAEQAVVKGVEDRGKKYDFYNAALVSLAPKTGQILAMVGSKDYFDLEHDGNVNVVLSSRQPGSSIKPLIYTLAWQKGYTPNTILYDVDTLFKTDSKDYHPSDYDGKERGPISMRSALDGSLNIPAVKALYLVGVDKVLDFMELLGYTTVSDRSRFGLSLVLGGAEVKLLEHAAAYATLANGGVYNPPAAILRVEDSKGNVLYEYKKKDRKVIDENIVNITSDVLSDNAARAYIFGEKNSLTLPDRPVAAKTGTTNDYKDAWTMGYTPSIVTGVWVGNNDSTEMSKGADGSVVAAPIWNQYMRKATEGTPVELFPAATIDTTGKPVLDGDLAGGTIVKIDKYTGKLATALTPPSYVEEKRFRNAHCILYYVNKDDPRGPAPSDPASADSAYATWEEGVQNWLKKQPGGDVPTNPNDVAPTEYDDVHVEANKPTIFIQSPRQNDNINNSYLDATVEVSAPRGVGRVEYYLDDKLIGTNRFSPFSLHYLISDFFGKGYHTLKAVAYDDVDNSNEASVEINILVTGSSLGLNWDNLSNYQTISSFPYTMRGSFSDFALVRKIDFYQKKIDNNQINIIGSIINPTARDFSIDWAGVYEKGEYQIYAEMTDYNGNKHTSSVVLVNVN